MLNGKGVGLDFLGVQDRRQQFDHVSPKKFKVNIARGETGCGDQLLGETNDIAQSCIVEYGQPQEALGHCC